MYGEATTPHALLRRTVGITGTAISIRCARTVLNFKHNSFGHSTIRVAAFSDASPFNTRILVISRSTSFNSSPSQHLNLSRNAVGQKKNKLHGGLDDLRDSAVPYGDAGDIPTTIMHEATNSRINSHMSSAVDQ